MTVSEQRPGLARIQVAATLRRMREQAGVTREHAATELYCTTSKIGDIETGRSRMRPAELEKLLDLYGARGAERDLLIETARDARSRRRRSRSEPSIPVGEQRFFDLEAQARSLTFFSPELLPGFLQTDEYARALLEWGGQLSASEIDSRLALRVAQRKIMTRSDPPPPACWCILGEAALRSCVGGPVVMAAQLEHLLERMAALRHLVIQVLPLGSGVHGSMGVTRTLLMFDPPAGDILHVDTEVRSVYFDGPTEVVQAAYMVNLLKAKALDRDESRAVIRRVVREYEEMSGDAAME